MTSVAATSGTKSGTKGKLHSARKTRLKESIRQALAQGLITDETLAYIRALSYARHQDPANKQVQEALCETLLAVQLIYEEDAPAAPLRELDSAGQLAREKLGEGLSAHFDTRHETSAVSMPSPVLSYLEEQRILMLPLEQRSSRIVDAGRECDFGYCLSKNENPHRMFTLQDHWIGLYFCVDPRLAFKDSQTGACRSAHPAEKPFEKRARPEELPGLSDPALPVTVDNTTLTFVDANLCGANIDLFYPGLRSQLGLERSEGHARILHLSLVFKSCRVKGMNLQFWRYISNFPGSVTISFKECDDFDEEHFPYLFKERDGKRYYLNLERLSDVVGSGADDKFLQYLDHLQHLSEDYQHEHLR